MLLTRLVSRSALMLRFGISYGVDAKFFTWWHYIKLDP